MQQEYLVMIFMSRIRPRRAWDEEGSDEIEKFMHTLVMIALIIGGIIVFYLFVIGHLSINSKSPLTELYLVLMCSTCFF